MNISNICTYIVYIELFMYFIYISIFLYNKLYYRIYVSSIYLPFTVTKLACTIDYFRAIAYWAYNFKINLTFICRLLEHISD